MRRQIRRRGDGKYNIWQQIIWSVADKAMPVMASQWQVIAVRNSFKAAVKVRDAVQV